MVTDPSNFVFSFFYVVRLIHALNFVITDILVEYPPDVQLNTTLAPILENYISVRIFSINKVKLTCHFGCIAG
jgi:hypothetical protein